MLLLRPWLEESSSPVEEALEERERDLERERREFPAREKMLSLRSLPLSSSSSSSLPSPLGVLFALLVLLVMPAEEADAEVAWGLFAAEAEAGRDLEEEDEDALLFE